MGAGQLKQRKAAEHTVKTDVELGTVVHISNPSHSGGRSRRTVLA